MAYATISSGDPTQEIHDLTLRTQSLNGTLDWWNTVMIWALIFGAIAGVAVIVATRMVILKSGQLADAQVELGKAKDRQLAFDLKAKDEKIASLNAKALSLQTELMKQGPRANLLIGETRKELVDALKPFPGQKIDVQPTAVIGSFDGIPTGIEPLVEERDGLAKSLIRVLHDAGWGRSQNSFG